MDGDAHVAYEYVGEKQDYRDWKQTFGDRLLKAIRKSDGRDIRFITKLSNNDVRLINKALQRFEVIENEIYIVNVTSINGVGKSFCVLVKSKRQWDFVGIQYYY